VLEAARESWGSYGPEFDCEPVRLRIVVEPEGEHAGEPSFRQQGHLLSIVSDRGNFGSATCEPLSGCGFIARKTALDHAWLRWFFLESMVQVSLKHRYFAAAHAACVACNEIADSLETMTSYPRRSKLSSAIGVSGNSDR